MHQHHTLRRSEAPRELWRLSVRALGVWRRENPGLCPDHASTRRSCWIAACGWWRSRAVRSRMWPGIWELAVRCCASVSARRRLTVVSGRLSFPLASGRSRGIFVVRCPAAAGQRDLEGRDRVFRSGARSDPAKMTAYIESPRSVFGVEPVCRALGVATSTHYARLSRPPSQRSIRDAQLIGEIRAAREGYRAAYGVRKTWKQLRRQGVTDCGRERVARLMRADGLCGVQRAKKRRTTTPDESARDRARDLVNRDFTASRPDQLWVADLERHERFRLVRW